MTFTRRYHSEDKFSEDFPCLCGDYNSDKEYLHEKFNNQTYWKIKFRSCMFELKKFSEYTYETTATYFCDMRQGGEDMAEYFFEEDGCYEITEYKKPCEIKKLFDMRVLPLYAHYNMFLIRDRGDPFPVIRQTKVSIPRDWLRYHFHFDWFEEDMMNILKQKHLLKLQRRIKEILYNPHTRRGREFALSQIGFAFEDDEEVEGEKILI